ncbi:hypothetical protein DIPPA_25968 [Diplonema papillatum]|nr:hypothetical protein DIPPA_25968 [Diplonema papillatum]
MSASAAAKCTTVRQLAKVVRLGGDIGGPGEQRALLGAVAAALLRLGKPATQAASREDVQTCFSALSLPGAFTPRVHDPACISSFVHLVRARLAFVQPLAAPEAAGVESFCLANLSEIAAGTPGSLPTTLRFFARAARLEEPPVRLLGASVPFLRDLLMPRGGRPVDLAAAAQLVRTYAFFSVHLPEVMDIAAQAASQAPPPPEARGAAWPRLLSALASNSYAGRHLRRFCILAERHSPPAECVASVVCFAQLSHAPSDPSFLRSVDRHLASDRFEPPFLAKVGHALLRARRPSAECVVAVGRALEELAGADPASGGKTTAKLLWVARRMLAGAAGVPGPLARAVHRLAADAGQLPAGALFSVAFLLKRAGAGGRAGDPAKRVGLALSQAESKANGQAGDPSKRADLVLSRGVVSEAKAGGQAGDPAKPADLAVSQRVVSEAKAGGQAGDPAKQAGLALSRRFVSEVKAGGLAPGGVETAASFIAWACAGEMLAFDGYWPNESLLGFLTLIARSSEHARSPLVKIDFSGVLFGLRPDACSPGHKATLSLCLAASGNYSSAAAVVVSQSSDDLYTVVEWSNVDLDHQLRLFYAFQPAFCSESDRVATSEAVNLLFDAIDMRLARTGIPPGFQASDALKLCWAAHDYKLGDLEHFVSVLTEWLASRFDTVLRRFAPRQVVSLLQCLASTRAASHTLFGLFDREFLSQHELGPAVAAQVRSAAQKAGYVSPRLPGDNLSCQTA